MKRTKTLLAVAVLIVMASCGKKVEVSLSKSSIDFIPEGGDIEVALTSNGDWTATSSVEWIAVSPASGKGDATLVVTAMPNSDNEPRQAQVVVTAKDKEALLTVNQDFSVTPFLRIEPNQITCDHLGGTFEVEVISNIEWRLGQLPEGISVSATEGTGNAIVSVTVSPIEGDLAGRNLTLVFTGGNILVSLEINQSSSSNLDVTVSPTQLAFGYEGGSETVAVTCNGSWTAESNEEWLTLSVPSGEGNAEVVVTAAESDVFVSREAYVTFRSSVGLTALVYVSQRPAPDPHFLTVNPTEFFFSAEGGMQTFNIGCDTEWNIDLDADWVLVSTASGTGNAEVALTVSSNTLEENRKVDFAVISGDLIQRLTIVQEPGDEQLVATLSPDTLSAPYTGTANASFAVTSNTLWHLEASDWISNLPTSEIQGDATVNLIVDLNLDPSPRHGFVRVIHNGQVLAESVVAQEGKPDLLEVNMAEVEMRPEGGSFTIHVTSNQSWTVVCDVQWIHFTPTSGFGNGEVTVTVDPMASTRPRIGVITLKAVSGRTVTVTVTQHQ